MLLNRPVLNGWFSVVPASFFFLKVENDFKNDRSMHTLIGVHVTILLLYHNIFLIYSQCVRRAHR